MTAARALLRTLTIFFMVAAGWAVYEWFTEDMLAGYSRTSSETIPDCEVHVVVGHYTKIPHRWITGPCAGVTLKGCNMGDGVYDRWLRPDVDVPAKEVTPFPGAQPLSTTYQRPDDTFAQGILADFDAAKAHARALLAICDCASIKVKLDVRFGDGWYDQGIVGQLRARGVTSREEVVTR